MIYTSGSTGRPKGAMNTHRAIVNRLLWMQEAYGLDAGDRVLQKTPFSFDVSVWEFFWPLITGATLVDGPAGRPPRPGLPQPAHRGARVTTMPFRALDARGVRRGGRRRQVPPPLPGHLQRRGPVVRPAGAVLLRDSTAWSCTTSTARPRRRWT